MGRAILGPGALPLFTDKELARLDSMTSDDIERNARMDAENPPLTTDELMRLRTLARTAQRDTVLDMHPGEKAQRPAYRQKLAGDHRVEKRR